jgi:hypothetical protein
VISGFEMFGFKGELFFSVLEFEEVLNLMPSMRVTSIDEEPLSFITFDINMALEIFL